MTPKKPKVIPPRPTLIEWAEALESGRYLQGTGALRPKTDQYCCLGVWCDLVDGTAWQAIYGTKSSRQWRRSDGLPPRTECFQLKKLGIDITEYARLNDASYSFCEIAAKIREAAKERE
ncbi:MAG: hypothetical protein ACREBU_02675 [Nitrososphaera sp.]